MPKKNYIRKKVQTKRRKVPKTGLLVLSRPGQVIPRTAYAVFKTRYKFGVLGTNTLSSSGSFVAKMNSCYLPFNTGSVDGTNIYNITGYVASTAQPAGFSQYCSQSNGLYLYQRVYKSTIKVTTMGGQVGKAYNFCVFPIESGVSVGDYEKCTNYPNSKVANFASIYAPKTITNSMLTAKIAGVTNKVVMTDDTYQGNDVQDPTAQYTWIISWQSSNSATPGAGGDPIFEVELTNYVKLEQPNFQDVSSSQ